MFTMLLIFNNLNEIQIKNLSLMNYDLNVGVLMYDSCFNKQSVGKYFGFDKFAPRGVISYCNQGWFFQQFQNDDYQASLQLL